MIITDLITGRFVKRPNRFLVLFEVGNKVFEAHLKDPGRLIELLTPGVKLLLKRADNITKRKTKFDVIGVLHQNKWVIINSSLHSDLAANLIESNFLKELAGYTIVKREYSYGKSRIDFLLRKEEKKMLLEVKGCTLVDDGLALFPDAPTSRGLKHLMELIKALEEGYYAAILFLVLREDAIVLSPNIDTDPEFSSTLRLAYEAGVQIFSYSYKIFLNEDKLRIIPKKRIKIEI